MSNFWRLSLAAAALIGVATGSLFLWIALDHNAQGELVSASGEVDTWLAFQIFGMWAIIGSAIVTATAILIYRLFRLGRNL